MYFSRQSRSTTADKNNQIMLYYLVTSNYLQYLRNTYPHFLELQEQQKMALVRNAELFRVKQDHTTMIVNYNQPTLSIMVYGQVQVNHKLYQKGTHFSCQQAKVEMVVVKKCLIMMLNKKQIEDIMRQYQVFYTKKTIIQNIFPQDIVKFQRKDFKILCNQIKIIQNESKQPFKLVFNNQQGIYIFYEGTFVLLNEDNLKIVEIYHDFYGEQCLWDQKSKFHIQPLTYNHKYMWISKVILEQILSYQSIMKLKENHQKKQAIRKQLEKQCQNIMKDASKLMKSQKQSLILKKFTPKQKQFFNQTLDLMEKKVSKPKWLMQQEKQQSEWQLKRKRKNIGTAKRTKSTYFSTLQKYKGMQNDYQEVFHKKQLDPFSMKMRLEQRVPPKLQYLRRTKTQEYQPKSIQKMCKTTSFSYYSHNYDRTYSMGMTNLSKMKKYDQLKKTSTLKKGEKILNTKELSQALSVSFGELSSVLACQNRKYRANPQQLYEKNIKRNKLLAKRIMEKKGASTWR